MLTVIKVMQLVSVCIDEKESSSVVGMSVSIQLRQVTAIAVTNENKRRFRCYYR